MEVDNGNLLLVLRDFGWGSAKDVSVDVDLSPFESSLLIEKTRKLKLHELLQYGFGPDHIFTSTAIILVRKDEITFDRVPQTLRAPQLKKQSRANEGVFWKQQEVIRSNGLHGLNARISYVDQNGRSYTETVVLSRIQRGAYDNRNIYYSSAGFSYVDYDNGIRYSLIPPSASYNFLVDVDRPNEIQELSIAHEVPPGGFDRLSLTVGATKSALLTFLVEFSTSAGRTFVSPEMAIEIWNPRNTFVNVVGGARVGDVLPSKDASESAPYDVQSLKAKRSRTWGY